MDLATIIGLVMAFGAVFGGAALEGVHMTALIQPTAAIIVLGGTFGATFVCFPLSAIINALKGVKVVFLPAKVDHEQVVKDIINYATKARRNGLISLEQEAQSARDPFIKKGISLVVDGIDPQKLRETLEADIMAYEDHTKHTIEFYEAAGGFSPTIGIIGAVLGLIHVMANLSDTSKLGGGIAVAFVATIYGLIVANVICLPIGTKLKIRMKEEMLRRIMILEGLIAIQNGENPHFIEQKLMAYVGGH
ncbi:MAG: flagellar motor protein [Proteobacteria bacterium]|nr:flagellar motor protein [Pseudomonadota bacterium]